MANLIITSKKSEVKTIDGNQYMFTRSNIDYTVFIKDDCVDVWKQNNQRGSLSSDCFWNGINNQGKPMAKFLKSAIDTIEI